MVWLGFGSSFFLWFYDYPPFLKIRFNRAESARRKSPSNCLLQDAQKQFKSNLKPSLSCPLTAGKYALHVESNGAPHGVGLAISHDVNCQMYDVESNANGDRSMHEYCIHLTALSSLWSGAVGRRTAVAFEFVEQQYSGPGSRLLDLEAGGKSCATKRTGLRQNTATQFFAHVKAEVNSPVFPIAESGSYTSCLWPAPPPHACVAREERPGRRFALSCDASREQPVDRRILFWSYVYGRWFVCGFLRGLGAFELF